MRSVKAVFVETYGNIRFKLKCNTRPSVTFILPWNYLVTSCKPCVIEIGPSNQLAWTLELARVHFWGSCCNSSPQLFWGVEIIYIAIKSILCPAVSNKYTSRSLLANSILISTFPLSCFIKELSTTCVLFTRGSILLLRKIQRKWSHLCSI